MTDYAAQLAEQRMRYEFCTTGPGRALGQRFDAADLLKIAEKLAAIVAALDEPDDPDESGPKPESHIDRDCRQYHEGA